MIKKDKDNDYELRPLILGLSVTRYLKKILKKTNQGYLTNDRLDAYL